MSEKSQLTTKYLDPKERSLIYLLQYDFQLDQWEMMLIKFYR